MAEPRVRVLRAAGGRRQVPASPRSAGLASSSARGRHATEQVLLAQDQARSGEGPRVLPTRKCRWGSRVRQSAQRSQNPQNRILLDRKTLQSSSAVRECKTRRHKSSSTYMYIYAVCFSSQTQQFAVNTGRSSQPARGSHQVRRPERRRTTRPRPLHRTRRPRAHLQKPA